MQGIFQKENTDKALKYGIYRHLPTYEKIIRNLVSFYSKKSDDLELSKGSGGIPHCEAYRCSSCKKILIDYANR